MTDIDTLHARRRIMIYTVWSGSEGEWQGLSFLVCAKASSSTLGTCRSRYATLPWYTSDVSMRSNQQTV